MDKIILSPIELTDLLNQVRSVVREEIAAAGFKATDSNKKPVTQKELSAYLGVTPATVIRWKKKKVIPFYTIGTAIRFDLDKVIKALGK